MKLHISRPWNPAYQETFNAMSPSERRGSFFVDCVIVLSVIFLLSLT